MTTMTTLDEDARAAMIRAASGTRRLAGEVPCGIRVVSGPVTKAVVPSPQPTADSAKPAPAQSSTSEPMDTLLRLAAASTRARTRALGIRLRDLAAELETCVVAEREQEAAAARVADLRRQLAEAEAAERQLRRPQPAAVEPTASAATVDMREVRAWANTNGVACNATGRVPGHVVAAWQAATGVAQ